MPKSVRLTPEFRRIPPTRERRISRPRRVWRPKVIDTSTEISASTVHSPRSHCQSEGPTGLGGEYGTCYAYAAATAIRSAQMRIFGRAVESHACLVNVITKKYGCNGGHTFQVLQDMCSRYRLHCERMNLATAERLVSSRVVVAAFQLDSGSWRKFSCFFTQQPEGTLCKKDIAGAALGQYEGHSVVIVGQLPDTWMIKNSWGNEFAEDGFFRVKKDALDFEFIDVHFLLTDLSPKELKIYCRAPPVLDVHLEKNMKNGQTLQTITDLGWHVDFQTMRILRVGLTKASPVSQWNFHNPFERIYPGYQIFAVNGEEECDVIIEELRRAEKLHIRLVISDPCKLDDVLDTGARCHSYAHAVASAIRSSQMRIFGRVVDLHDDVAAGLIQDFGSHDIDLAKVLSHSCSDRKLRWFAIDAVSAEQVLQTRNLIASFSLKSAAWKRFSDFFIASPTEVLHERHLWPVLDELDSIEQSVAVTIVGHEPTYWEIKDPMSWDVSVRSTLRVAKGAIDFKFYDVCFFMTDLLDWEVKYYQEAPSYLLIKVKRKKKWVKGISALGWTIDAPSMQIEWIADWGPIADVNKKLPHLYQVRPGHKIIEVNTQVNTHVRPEAIIYLLTTANNFTIKLAKFVHPHSAEEQIHHQQHKYSYAGKKTPSDNRLISYWTSADPP